MKMANFNIVEDTKPRYLDRYDEFIELYLDPDIRKPELLKRLDWSNNTYKQARRHAVENGDLPDDKRKKPVYYFYAPRHDRWIVAKRNKRVFLQVYCHTEEEAISLRDYLDEHGWTKENVIKWKRSVV